MECWRLTPGKEIQMTPQERSALIDNLTLRPLKVRLTAMLCGTRRGLGTWVVRSAWYAGCALHCLERSPCWYASGDRWRGVHPRDAHLIAAAPNLLSAMEKINEWCCYASEENIDARLTALQQIGIHARAAIATTVASAA